MARSSQLLRHLCSTATYGQSDMLTNIIEKAYGLFGKYGPTGRSMSAPLPHAG